nr:flippase [Thermococcus nautili]
MSLNFFYMMYTARYLGPTNYGILAFALALNGIFGVIANFGLDPLTVREVARNKDLAGAYLINGIVLKSLFGILVYMMVFLVVTVLGYPDITRTVVYIITIATIFRALSKLPEDIYQAFEKMEFISIGQIINGILLFVFSVSAINLKLNVVYLALAYLGAQVFTFIYYLFITLEYLKLETKIEPRVWRKTLKEAWPFALSSVFVALYFWVDSVMLSYLKGNGAVGVYNASYMLVYALLIIPNVYFSALYPVLSKIYLESKESLKFAYTRSLKYFAVLGIFIGVTTVLFSREAILLIYGKAYEAAVPALKILIWAVVFSFMAHSTLYTLNSMNKQIIYTKVTAFGAVLNFILNIFAIQRWSYIGASITTVITEALGFLVMFVYLKRFLNDSLTSYLWVVKFIPVVFVSIIFYHMALEITKNFIILLLIYTLGYWGGILVFRIIDGTDISLLKRIRV